MAGNDGTGDTPERDRWATNAKLWNNLSSQYLFEFDCCASEDNTKTEKYSDDFEKVNEVEGVAWMNPPFSKAMVMFRHFFEVVAYGVAIYRCDNMETKLWQDIIFPNATWILVLRGRLGYSPFDKETGKRDVGARFPSALIGFNVPPPETIPGVVVAPKLLIAENNWVRIK